MTMMMMMMVVEIITISTLKLLIYQYTVVTRVCF